MENERDRVLGEYFAFDHGFEVDWEEVPNLVMVCSIALELVADVLVEVLVSLPHVQANQGSEHSQVLLQGVPIEHTGLPKHLGKQQLRMQVVVPTDALSSEQYGLVVQLKVRFPQLRKLLVVLLPNVPKQRRHRRHGLKVQEEICAHLE